MKWLIVYSDNESETIEAKDFASATKKATVNAEKRQRTYKLIEEIKETKE